MSRGLGSAQRRVLVELYKLLLDDAEELGLAEDGYNECSGYSIEQMELEPRPGRVGSDGKLITAHVRRSKRVPFRRALTSLDKRGLVETGIAEVELEELGQYSEYESWRDVRVALLTHQGCRYIEERYRELVAEFPQLNSALEKSGFLINGKPGHVTLSAATDRLYTRSEVIRLLADEGDDLVDAVWNFRANTHRKQKEFLVSEIPFYRRGSRQHRESML
ncbi:hypothetical protein AB0C34_31070 [Nocardia sp. NPDC049220]|uniref:hypothetical protein n=1 Tax=Nocardia sp. NPDC049220 TaxID=3155273 RepID=UPI003401C8BE